MYLKHAIFFIGLLAISIVCVNAQQTSPENPWQQFIAKNKSRVFNTKTSTLYQLVQFAENTSRHDLVVAGIKIIRRLDKNFAIVKNTKTSEVNFKNQWVANDLWKLGPGIVAISPNKKHSVFLKATDQFFTQDLKALDIEIVNEINKNTFLINASGNTILNQLLHTPGILYIGKESQKPTADSRVIDLNLNVNTVNLLHDQFPELDGNGITVSIQEQHFNENDIDIMGRIIPSDLASDEQSNHATAMATIVAGAGNTFVNGQGVAPSAQVTSSDFADVLPDADGDYATMDISVQNHSYGTRIENFYGVEAEAFDLSANNNPTLLHVMSSGNLGFEQDTVGTYRGVAGFANLSGNFKMTKNTLVVGSVDTVGRTVDFVSRGPAFDGRVKPELVTYSTAGSSNSAALVSGIVTVLQQAYKEAEGALPESALIKALLVNSAKDVSTPAVDFLTGYGNVDAHRTLQNLLAHNYIVGAIDDQETQTFILTVPANVQNLKVTIAWNDPAAEPNANLVLSNDIDMSVMHSSTTWKPWVLNTDASLLAQPAMRGEDHLNNIEQITVANPTAGDYTLSVNGHDIPYGPQKFYIAYQWDEKGRFEWAFPTASDNMPYDGETGSYFRWDSTLPGTTGKLEYSIDDGYSWNLIADNVDLTKGYYRWSAPQINSKAQARMTVGGTTYTTNNFTISRPIALDVGFNCTDSVGLQWPRVSNASGYSVYTMGNQYLKKVLNTTDTAFVFSKSDFQTRYFTVQPHLNDGSDMIKSYTIDYNLKGTSCFLISFYAEVTHEDELFLNLQLGTTYGIEKVSFECKNDQGFEEIYNASPTDESIRMKEQNPLQGLNTYRARIKFMNGEEIVSDESLVYFLTEQPFLVFPNPLAPGDELNVYSKDFEPGTTRIFTLYSRTGQIVRQETLYSTREFVSTSGLEPGLYLYKVTANGEEATGRIVIVE